MKHIVAYFRKNRVSAVRSALLRLGRAQSGSFSQIRRAGQRLRIQRRPPTIYDLLKGVPFGYRKREIITQDQSVSMIVSVIEAAAGVGGPGNGRIYVLDAL
jgi:nitrogen regulatory protein PII